MTEKWLIHAFPGFRSSLKSSLSHIGILEIKAAIFRLFNWVLIIGIIFIFTCSKTLSPIWFIYLWSWRDDWLWKLQARCEILICIISIILEMWRESIGPHIVNRHLHVIFLFNHWAWSTRWELLWTFNNICQVILMFFLKFLELRLIDSCFAVTKSFK